MVLESGKSREAEPEVEMPLLQNKDFVWIKKKPKSGGSIPPPHRTFLLFSLLI
jgi:hypothetical protein